jgi:hypothetical protein
MSTHIITRPKVEIDPKLLDQLQHQIQEMGQVVIHFVYYTPPYVEDSRIRIWPTTYLYDHNSPHKSELVHAENITYYPEWHKCVPGTNSFFTLIFSGLPRSCSRFDCIEECDNQWGAFEIRNMVRNQSDVYYVQIL